MPQEGSTKDPCGDWAMKRRDFLKASVASAAYFSVSGLTLPPRTAQAALANLDGFVTVDLVAEVAQKTVATATTGATRDVNVPVWQFRDMAAPGPGRLTSGLQVRAGDVLTVNLTNSLDRPVNFVVPGLFPGPLETSPAVPPGGSATYTFRPTATGSYFYTDDVNGKIGQAMGLSGPLVVLPRGITNSVVVGGSEFSKQYTLMLSEMDSRLNTDIAAGRSFDMANYEPNYFFINGMSYPLTVSDPSTFINMKLNDLVAIRFINAGFIYYPMHFHGYHVNVVLRNRAKEAVVVSKDTVLVSVGECVDTELNVNQVGDYPMHSHYLPAVTANGVYPYGNMLLMRAV